MVEVLSQSKHSDLSYEDGLIRIEEKAPSVGIQLFSEEMLLRHAHSVVGQIESYEQAEESDIQELFLMHSPFMKGLIEYSGYKPKNGYSGRARNPTTKPPPSQCSMATTTPLVRHVFECFFKNQG